MTAAKYTPACRARAKELGVSAAQYRRWESGADVPEVKAAIEAEAAAKKEKAA